MVCRGVIVVKHIATLLIVQNIQRDVVTSVPFQGVTVKTDISTSNKLASAVLSGISFPRKKLPNSRLPR